MGNSSDFVDSGDFKIYRLRLKISQNLTNENRWNLP